MRIWNHLLFNITFTLLITLANLNPGCTQHWEQNLFFRNLSSNDGLSNPTINSIVQDHLGYIWIGTIDGLNRYDGYQMVTYKYNPADSNSLLNNRINRLAVDENNTLWIGTQDGLCSYNYKEDAFTTYKKKGGNYVVSDFLLDTQNNRVWVGSTRNCLRFLDLESKEIKEFSHDLLDGLTGIHAIDTDGKSIFLSTNNKGLLKLDIQSLKLVSVASTQNGLVKSPTDWVTASLSINDKYFIGTNGFGLMIYDLKTENLEILNTANSPLKSNIVKVIISDKQGKVYVGTEFGLFVYSPSSGSGRLHVADEFNPSTLSSNLIRDLYFDHEDNLWVGVFQNGVDYLRNEISEMNLVRKQYKLPNSLTGDNISCFAQDNNGGLWIGTHEAGLNYYNKGKYHKFQESPSVSLLKNITINDIKADQNGVIWMGTNEGLFSYQEQEFRKHPLTSNINNITQSELIKTISIDEEGLIWLATQNSIISFDPKTQVFTKHQVDLSRSLEDLGYNIRGILAGNDGLIYAGSSAGLHVYNPKDKRVKNFKKQPDNPESLGHNIIIEIFEDREGRIWLGSLGGGLILFDKENEVFKTYFTNTGLPDGSVKTIEQDEQGFLWMGTNKGLVKFDPATEKSIVFGKSFGLQNEQFNINASIKLKDGRLIFGGVNGFNVFLPKDIHFPNSAFKVVITDFKIFDHSLSPTDSSNFIHEHISLVSEMEIPFSESKHFTISFSGLQHMNIDNVEYAYQLEGFESNWRFIGKEHKVTFTNLDPGTYNFLVKASSDGNWNNQPTQLQINILPPWYLTVWFRILISVVSLVLIAGILLYREEAHKRSKKRLQVLVDEQNKELLLKNEELISSQEELNAQFEKLKETHNNLKETQAQLIQSEKMASLGILIAGVAHEINNPLNFINAGTIALEKYFNRNFREQKEEAVPLFEVIKKGVSRTAAIVKSLNHFSRRNDLQKENCDIHLIIQNCLILLRNQLKNRIEVEKNYAKENLEITGNEGRLHQAILNILVNAYQAIEGKGKIMVESKVLENNAVISFKDTGCGIKPENLLVITDPFFTTKEVGKGTGLGLAITKKIIEEHDGIIEFQSKENQGTTVIITFPI
ncbi:sensor histidine kinase [Flexithrix dorotheae]|uniref:sensor histidine kinase n=1 Tax=Flexithrix dorotheae TaxID=70993 RepID=UPI00035DB59F|nr:two-component regulator propeller domain-containing protein [Flexithrix dorotheae]